METFEHDLFAALIKSILSNLQIQIKLSALHTQKVFVIKKDVET